MNKAKQLFFLLSIGLFFIACESEYSRTVKNELKTEVVHEDLILGLKIGQTQKEFYDHCWQLNKEKIVHQGPGNRFARHYLLLDSTAQDSKKVDMLFYGIFDEEKVMHGMHMIMSYVGWSPWAKEYQANILLEELKKKYLREYAGNPFIEITIDEDIKAYAKVDGNRQIVLYPSSDKDVTVKIQDLRNKIQ